VTTTITAIPTYLRDGMVYGHDLQYIGTLSPNVWLYFEWGKAYRITTSDGLIVRAWRRQNERTRWE